MLRLYIESIKWVNRVKTFIGVFDSYINILKRASAPPSNYYSYISALILAINLLWILGRSTLLFDLKKREKGRDRRAGDPTLMMKDTTNNKSILD